MTPPPEQPPDPGRGVGVDDLPWILHQQYLHAIRARALHDPTTHWEAFRDQLWHYLTHLLGIHHRRVAPGLR